MTKLAAIFSLQRKWLHCLLSYLLSKISNSVFLWLIGVRRECKVLLKISSPKHCLLEFWFSWSALPPSNLHFNQHFAWFLCALNFENHWYRDCNKKHGNQYRYPKYPGFRGSCSFLCLLPGHVRRTSDNKNSENSIIQGTYNKSRYHPAV